MVRGLLRDSAQKLRGRSPLVAAFAPGHESRRTTSINGWLGIIRRLSARIKDVKKILQMRHIRILTCSGNLDAERAIAICNSQMFPIDPGGRGCHRTVKKCQFPESFQPLAEFLHLYSCKYILIR